MSFFLLPETPRHRARHKLFGVATAFLAATLLLPSTVGRADARTTGQILANPHFKEWNQNAPASWAITEAGATQRGQQTPSGGYSLSVRPEDTSFVDIKQVFQEAPLLPGDTLVYEVRARCETPNAFQGLLRIYTSDDSTTVSHNMHHPGDGEWHILTGIVQVPDAPIDNLTIGVRGTQSLASPAEVAFVRAYIVPQIP